MKYLNSANLISISRVFLTIPTLLFFDSGNKNLGLFVLTVMIVTDFVDGIVSRKLNQVSDFGKALDPICDKIVLMGLFVYLVMNSNFPIWYFISIFSRDLILSYVSILIKRKKGVMPQPNVPGKIAISLVALFVITWFMEWEDVKVFAFWSSILFLLYSTAVYIRDYYKILYRGAAVEV